MPVLGVLCVTLELPTPEQRIKFYTDASLRAESDGAVARVRCQGQDRDSIVLIGETVKTQLQHLTLRAERPAEIESRVPGAGGVVIEPPSSPAQLYKTPENGVFHRV